MNVIITGANGFIGKILVKKLNNNNNVVRLINGNSYSKNDNEIICNLIDKNHVNSFLKESIEIDVIIHTASILTSSENNNCLSLFYDNIKMYENLLLIIEKYNPKKVLNLSSVAVYPNKDGEYSEDSEIKPSLNNDGLYGLSKFCGENILDFFYKNNSLCITHLRISQVYGEGVRGDRIFKIMRKELEDFNSITVFGEGRRVGNFIEINSLIEKLIYCIENTLPGIFNIGDKNLSYYDLAQDIIDKHGNLKSTIKLVDKGVASKTYINCEKFKNKRTKYGM
jgi:UDP-glucose 4-epimerase